mmetsp:Transcript_18490/g.31584  ORF Transcript_18490/g.31584 Transcript_18490/m.31584 type:complete len:140 (+) Transcript_18490:324-743(+)
MVNPYQRPNFVEHVGVRCVSKNSPDDKYWLPVTYPNPFDLSGCNPRATTLSPLIGPMHTALFTPTAKFYPYWTTTTTNTTIMVQQQQQQQQSEQQPKPLARYRNYRAKQTAPSSPPGARLSAGVLRTAPSSDWSEERSI